MLMLGYNVYIDDPEDVEVTGDYCYSRRHSRAEWKKLISKTSMHAIYDDHDFGLDDCIPGSLVDHPAWKKKALQNFTRNWNNPEMGAGEQNPGCWQFFALGKVEVLILVVPITGIFPLNSCLGRSKKNGSRINLKHPRPLLKLLLPLFPLPQG